MDWKKVISMVLSQVGFLTLMKVIADSHIIIIYLAKRSLIRPALAELIML